MVKAKQLISCKANRILLNQIRTLPLMRSHIQGIYIYTLVYWNIYLSIVAETIFRFTQNKLSPNRLFKIVFIRPLLQAGSQLLCVTWAHRWHQYRHKGCIPLTSVIVGPSVCLKRKLKYAMDASLLCENHAMQSCICFRWSRTSGLRMYVYTFMCLCEKYTLMLYRKRCILSGNLSLVYFYSLNFNIFRSIVASQSKIIIQN